MCMIKYIKTIYKNVVIAHFFYKNTVSGYKNGDDMIEQLQRANPTIKLHPITSTLFHTFGQILPFHGVKEAAHYLQDTVIPNTGNSYIAHDEQFIKALHNTSLYDSIFGYIPLQYGYVNGHNQKINALEYHKSSEINIALDDMILFVGKTSDINRDYYDLSHTIAFYVPQNTVYELYPEVLHFSPCAVTSKGFRCGVILPKGTNLELPTNVEPGYLFKTNKWLLAHPEATHLLEKGALSMLQGINVEIHLIEDEI